MMILLLSTSDTDLLAARASGEGWRVANPTRVGHDQIPELLDGVRLVVVRLLGGRAAWEEGLAVVLASGRPTLVLGGETVADPELMEASTVPTGILTQSLAYLVEGGPANQASLARFLRATLLLTGEPCVPPGRLPAFGVHRTPADGPGPTVGIVFYRAHAVSGNTAFIDVLADAVEAAGGRALAVYTQSLRTAPDEFFGLLGEADALVVTVLA
ncbi:MAG: cobaltochelatase subunit CobN, partial [Actinomycetes bacterium]